MLCVCASPSACFQSTTHVRVTTVALHKCSLSLKNLQCFLQTIDLSFTTRLPLLVGLGLRNATIFEFRIILIHSGKLTAHSLFVRGEVSNSLRQTFHLCGFVFQVLVLHSLSDLVLLRDVIVHCLCVILFCLLFSKPGCKVRLYHLKNTNDAGSSTCGLRVQGWHGRLLHQGSIAGIVVTKN